MDYIVKENADIVALQETKCNTNKLPSEIKVPGYHHYYADSKNKSLMHIIHIYIHCINLLIYITNIYHYNRQKSWLLWCSFVYKREAH